MNHSFFGDAIAREKQIKAGSWVKKEALIRGMNPECKDLTSEAVITSETKIKWDRHYEWRKIKRGSHCEWNEAICFCLALLVTDCFALLAMKALLLFLLLQSNGSYKLPKIERRSYATAKLRRTSIYFNLFCYYFYSTLIWDEAFYWDR